MQNKTARQWLIILLLSVFGGRELIAQEISDTTVVLPEVVISAYSETPETQSSFHIESLSAQTIQQQGPLNLTDALSRIPGVSQLGTGPFITKPVIRGLYGNRILVLQSGLRFDNQQWQDEHGLGLSDIGVSRIELIKGPLSLLYGTDAVGGVINILEEEKADSGVSQLDAGLKFHSNTLGETFQAGYKSNVGKKWFRIRGGLSSHADYSDGGGNRVFNSRFCGYYLKSGLGFKRGNWTSENSYLFSFSQFGFVFDQTFTDPGNAPRWTRSMQEPHHIVLLNLFSSQNRIDLPHSHLDLAVGLQSNYRAEDEGGGQLSLKMHLFTGQYSLKWRKNLSPETELVLANLASLENNVNYGGRKIIPDAWMGESTFSGYLRHNLGRTVLEAGLGGGFRGIQTLLTPTVNTPDKDIAPFAQGRFFGNGMAGLCLNPVKSLSIRMISATGVRAPNLAELSSNGLHEGIYTYEMGDPNLRMEENLNTEVNLDYSQKWFNAHLAGYANFFRGYIYLEPTDEDWFGFPVFRFRQKNALIKGGEARLGLTPPMLKGLEISVTWSGLEGRLQNRDFLPYMPAQKLVSEVRYEFSHRQLCGYAFLNHRYVFSQRQTAPLENPTGGYQLVNSGLGIDFPSRKAKYTLSLAANNLLNELYFDHLSRYKQFGLYNMGLDLSLNFHITFLNKH